MGGTIIDRDIPKLKDMGVAEVFPVGSDIDEIVLSLSNCLDDQDR